MRRARPAPKLRWEDVSSFGRDEKDRTPKSWCAKAGRFALSVSRHIHCAPDSWNIRVADLMAYELPGDVTAQEAQVFAEARLRLALNAALRDLTKTGGAA